MEPWEALGLSQAQWEEGNADLQRLMDEPIEVISDEEYAALVEEMNRDYAALMAEFDASPALAALTRTAVDGAQPQTGTPEGDPIRPPRRVRADERRQAAAMLHRLARELPTADPADRRVAQALDAAAVALSGIDLSNGDNQ